MNHIRYFAGVLLVTLLFTTCSNVDSQKENQDQTPPNFVFIIADDLSWKDLSAYGSKDVNTFNIDRLAIEGILFNNAYVSASSCSPSRASILTGRNGFELEQGATLWGYLPEKFTLYPDLLEKHGYKIGGTGKGWGPGFLMGRKRNPVGKMYNDIKGLPYKTEFKNIFIDSCDYAANFNYFLENEVNNPFCFWVGTHEPHRKYTDGLAEEQGFGNPEKITVPGFLPVANEIKKEINDYLFEVHHIDLQVGRVMQYLKQHDKLDNTIVVFTSDNGMPFSRAKTTLYDYGTRMPLIFWWGKNIKGNRTINDMVSLTDIAPTFLEFAGVDIPTEMSGNSLAPLIKSNKTGILDTSRNEIFFYLERHHWAYPGGKTYPSRGIRTPDYLLIWNPFPDLVLKPGNDIKKIVSEHKQDYPELSEAILTPKKEYELYDVNADPFQLNNLAYESNYSPVFDSLKTRLFEYLEQRKDPRILGHPEVFKNAPYFGHLLELRLLDPKTNNDGRNFTKQESIEWLKKGYEKRGEIEAFKAVAKSEGWEI